MLKSVLQQAVTTIKLNPKGYRVRGATKEMAQISIQTLDADLSGTRTGMCVWGAEFA